jgi:hypothetical protein
VSDCSNRPSLERAVCLGAREDLDVYTLYVLWGWELAKWEQKREEKHTLFSVLNIEYPFGKDRSNEQCMQASRRGYARRKGGRPGQTECSLPWASCYGYCELNIPDMEPIGSWTLQGICREVDPVERWRAEREG